MGQAKFNRFDRAKAIGQGWATVGGRIEEFALVLRTEGKRAARLAIMETYGDEARDVWNGLVVIVSYGFSAYYGTSVPEVKAEG